MGINGIGAGYPAWRETGKAQRNHSGVGFASRITGMVSGNTSKSSGKTDAVSGRDNYVGGNTSELSGIEASNSQVWISKFQSTKRLATGAEPSNYFNRERDLPDGEIEDTGSEEPETKTEIIVKPDGSRVLVMTTSIGGMETSMSMEISKPTKMLNDNPKQDINNMPTAENDTVSDGMPLTSNEG